MRLHFTFFVLFLTGIFSATAQMVVSNSVPNDNIDYLVNNQLMNSSNSAIASNVGFDGVVGQVGYFKATGTNLNMPEGVVLSTGGLGYVLPSSNGSSNYNTNNSDVDLAKLLNIVNVSNKTQKNAVVVEFDFVAGGDEVEFEYIFASDEYTGFTCSQFNDVFGFFISGPGISGPYTNGGKNIALVPNPSNPSNYTNTPVMINSINSGVSSSNSSAACSNLDPNWTAYSIFFTPNPSEATVGFNGFTKPLLAKASVICGETYHIKLAICDISDGAYNSAVFLKKGSFNAGSPLVLGIQNQNKFVICDNSVLIDPNVSGGFNDPIITWTNGENTYTQPTLTVTEVGNYSVLVTDSCTSIEHHFTVEDYVPMNLNIPDTLVLCNDSIYTADLTGGAPLFSYIWKKDGQVVANTEQIIIQQGQDGNYSVDILDQCGKTIQGSFYAFTPEKLEVSVNSELYLCEDNNTITATVKGGYGNVVYYWLVNGSKIESKSVTISDTQTGNIQFIATDDCGTYINKNIQIYSPSEFEDLSIEFDKTDFLMCRRDKKVLPVKISGGIGGHKVKWYINGELVSEIDNFVFDPNKYKNQTYTVSLNVSDDCANELKETFTITFSDCTVPNVFTPNNDNTNDVFYFPIGDFQEQVEFRVFNRWGMEVFTSENYERCNDQFSSDCWKGLNKTTGKECTDGIYYYIIKFKDGKVEKGSTMLFK